MELQVHGKCATQNYTLKVPESKFPLAPMFEFLSNFKFYIAVENTSKKHYVSEKLFLALGSGAIPVYLGASEAANTFPKLDGRSKWFVNARDFSTIKELAAYLLDLASNETKFNEYLQWEDYARSGGTWMPNATPALQECFQHNRSGFFLRHLAICRLCDQKYLEQAKQRTRIHPQKIPYPSSWGFPDFKKQDLQTKGKQTA